MKISASTARQLAIGCQGLDGGWNPPEGKERTAQTIEQLGYVQIDTITVIERAHHHTLWSRYPGYMPTMLDELQAKDRRVFEYWTHAASYVPVCDYRYYLPRMRGLADKPSNRQWRQQNAQLVSDVLSRIRAEGPLGASDFADTREAKRGSWWDWKPAKRALELLFNVGELMVTQRRNFQRIYDLTKHVLPTETDVTEPSPDELARFIVCRALVNHGIAPHREICWRRGNHNALRQAIDELVDSGEVTRVEIEGLSDETHYALTDNVEGIASQCQSRPSVHLLSPFDNLIIRRERIEKLFGFEYKLECYLPAEKRRYGYFCLPILWGEQFIGRVDPKADRRQKTFILRKIIFERDFTAYNELLPVFASKLWAFARFNGCERIGLDESIPSKVKTVLMQELAAVD